MGMEMEMGSGRSNILKTGQKRQKRGLYIGLTVLKSLLLEEGLQPGSCPSFFDTPASIGCKEIDAIWKYQIVYNL
jgi:hypothetical protein